MSESASNRDLTTEERILVRWLLEHGEPEARGFLPQLERAQVLPTRCPCGCASIDFSVDGQPKPSDGFGVLADFVFGTGDELCGIFVFEQSGVLAGLDVYGFAGDGPKDLPSPDVLRPIEHQTGNAQSSAVDHPAVNRSITPKGLRTIVAIVFVGTIFILLSQRYGPRAQQAENMARADQHISVLRPILNKDSRFTHIRLTSFTAAGGSLLVSGDLSSDQDLDALRQTVEGSSVPVEVVYQVSTATP